MEEFWKFIEATDGHYEVSNLGNIRKDGEIIDLEYSSVGYYKAPISFKFGLFRPWVHRIVAAYFCENPKNVNVVNHIDGNKLNNCASNLEWVTQSENRVHAIEVLGKRIAGKDNPMYGISGKDSPVFKVFVYQIDPETNIIIEKYEGARDAIRKNDNKQWNYSGIYKAIQNVNKTYKGFKWIRTKADLKPGEFMENLEKDNHEPSSNILREGATTIESVGTNIPSK